MTTSLPSAASLPQEEEEWLELPATALNTETDELIKVGLDQSAFYNCLALDERLDDWADTPAGLRPDQNLVFRKHEAKVAARYGVPDYLRQIHEFQPKYSGDEIITIFRNFRKRKSPSALSLAAKNFMRKTHIIDVHSRQLKSASNHQIYWRAIFPCTFNARIMKFDHDHIDSDYQTYDEELIALRQQEWLFKKGSIETLWELQPFGFTKHALERIWSRGKADGRIFHEVMRRALLQLRGVASIADIAFSLEKRRPDHIIIPFLDGYIISAIRHVFIDTYAKRSGLILNKNKMFDFATDYATNIEEIWSDKGTEGEIFIRTPIWWGVTFLSESEIIDKTRWDTLQRLKSITEKFDLERCARFAIDLVRQNNLIISEIDDFTEMPWAEFLQIQMDETWKIHQENHYEYILAERR